MQLAREPRLRGLQPAIETGDDAALEEDGGEDWELSHDPPDRIAPLREPSE